MPSNTAPLDSSNVASVPPPACPKSPYEPIENYGLIGNMHTVALVGMNGSIDWFCFPHFDSPSLFGALLDADKGGRFSLYPHTDSPVKVKQLYWPNTNVLMTKFFTPEGVAEVVDFMPVLATSMNDAVFHQIIRRVKITRGHMKLHMQCQPAFNYAQTPHRAEQITDKAVSFTTDALSLCLISNRTLTAKTVQQTAESYFELNENEIAFFILKEKNKETQTADLNAEEVEQLLNGTLQYWRGWLAQCTYNGRWREMVYRSALVLKLLTFKPTGAIVAAPTCSLPEHIGGVRNWDYRYTWIRDAAFTIFSLLKIGFTDEAHDFMAWLEARCKESHDGDLQIMYGIRGETVLTEHTLDHLSGYCNSRPVRVGNGAFDQRQLDIYGELFDAIYVYNKHAIPISYDLWLSLTRMLDWLCENWQLPDSGLWEARSGMQSYVFSRLMCWVALDRGIRLAWDRSFPANWRQWLHVRDEIYKEIMEKGWNPQLNAFVQSYGSDVLDASVLMMPLVFFVTPTDKRMVQTLECLMKPVDEGGLLSDSMVYRYNTTKADDGFSDPEGTFSICTFWLVDVLCRSGSRNPDALQKSRLIFETMLGYANHLGLFSEETGLMGESLGNFPQALTHLALISAAIHLDQYLDK